MATYSSYLNTQGFDGDYVSSGDVTATGDIDFSSARLVGFPVDGTSIVVNGSGQLSSVGGIFINEYVNEIHPATGTTVTVAGDVGETLITNNLQDTSLTSGDVVYASTGGLLKTANTFTFNDVNNTMQVNNVKADTIVGISTDLKIGTTQVYGSGLKVDQINSLTGSYIDLCVTGGYPRTDTLRPFLSSTINIADQAGQSITTYQLNTATIDSPTGQLDLPNGWYIYSAGGEPGIRNDAIDGFIMCKQASVDQITTVNGTGVITALNPFANLSTSGTLSTNTISPYSGTNINISASGGQSLTSNQFIGPVTGTLTGNVITDSITSKTAATNMAITSTGGTIITNAAGSATVIATTGGGTGNLFVDLIDGNLSHKVLLNGDVDIASTRGIRPQTSAGNLYYIEGYDTGTATYKAFCTVTAGNPTTMAFIQPTGSTLSWSGGSIDSAIIGGTTPEAGTFTSLTSDSLTARTTNSDLTLSGNGTGKVKAAKLKVDNIEENTVGGNINFNSNTVCTGTMSTINLKVNFMTPYSGTLISTVNDFQANNLYGVTTINSPIYQQNAAGSDVVFRNSGSATTTTSVNINSAAGGIALSAASGKLITITPSALVGVTSTLSPTASTQLNINSSTQNSARIVLSGQEFYAAGNTSTDGIALLAGVNRSGNRQLWIGDSANLTQNTTNPVIRIMPSARQIDCIATDGNTQLPLTIGSSGNSTTISGSLQVNGAVYVGTILRIPRVFCQVASNGSLLSLGGSYYSFQWNTTTFQNTTTSDFSASSFTNSNTKVTVPTNGIYTISWWFSNGSNTNEAYMILNSQTSNDLNIGAANNASIRLMGVCNLGEGGISWTGYLTTSDYFHCGMYSPTSRSVNSGRTGLSIALVNRTT